MLAGLKEEMDAVYEQMQAAKAHQCEHISLIAARMPAGAPAKAARRYQDRDTVACASPAYADVTATDQDGHTIKRRLCLGHAVMFRAMAEGRGATVTEERLQ